MAALRLFQRMILRPLLREPVRAALTAFSIALGVAVVVAIRLAGDAAAGSFHNSLETLQGDATLEITSAGGLSETVLAELVQLPYALEFRPRVEGYARVVGRDLTVPLLGLDLVATAAQTKSAKPAEGATLASLWCSASLGCRAGETLTLVVNDRRLSYQVAGSLDGMEHFLVLDIGEAQRALGREGRLDRIQVRLPRATGNEQADRDWAAVLKPALPPAAEIQAVGSGTESNRRMLTAFRWNLRVLSYIALLVGAFLIYNTISVSVVRRRAEIGVVRALGGTRALVTALFLVEAAAFGVLGSLVGVPAGRLMAVGAVKLLGATVQALYVSSTPGAIELSASAWMEALATGIGIALVAALAPAIEASRVSPVEAMARGHREHRARLRARRNLVLAVVLSLGATWAVRQGPVDGKPVYGYAACFLMVGAMALLIPPFVAAASPVFAALARRVLGVEALLAARSLRASLLRSSILIAALGTAISMMVSVGVMVGSFRQTVDTWMNDQLRADFYLRPASNLAAGRFPTFAGDVMDRIAALPFVAAVDRFRAYEIHYDGLPAILGAGEIAVMGRFGRTEFLRGDREKIMAQLLGADVCIVSEPFANKHGVREGDRLPLAIAGKTVAFRVAGVYHDYSNERGYVIVDRATLLRYLPDPGLSNAAVYIKPDIDMAEARKQLETAIAGREILLAANRSLREEGLRTFDRTFAVTWALEAVAIFVAVLGIAGALLAMVIDRRREMGLLRFLGGAPEQIRRMILCEAGLLGLLSLAAGVVLGSLLSLVLIYVINVQSFGWTIEFHWPTSLLLFALGGVFVSTIVAGLWPAREAVRLNPIEVIHEE